MTEESNDNFVSIFLSLSKKERAVCLWSVRYFTAREDISLAKIPFMSASVIQAAVASAVTMLTDESYLMQLQSTGILPEIPFKFDTAKKTLAKIKSKEQIEKNLLLDEQRLNNMIKPRLIGADDFIIRRFYKDFIITSTKRVTAVYLKKLDKPNRFKIVANKAFEKSVVEITESLLINYNVSSNFFEKMIPTKPKRIRGKARKRRRKK